MILFDGIAMRIELPNPNAFAQLFNALFKVELSVYPRGLATDSREVHPGDGYVAIRGDRVDGHQFLEEVAESGGVLALVQHPIKGIDLLQVPVPDPVKAVGRLARAWREQYQIPVIAITGSNGKTTTRELIKQILTAKYRVHGTEGNFNTSIGLPLTLLTLTEDYNCTVLEMGANRPGDIAELCAIALPTHGLITNVAPAHLEGFGSIQEIACTKGALFDALKAGVAFVNYSDILIKAQPVQGKMISYGFTPDCDFPADIHEETNGTFALTIDTHKLATESQNISFAKNILPAVTVTRTFGLDWDTIQKRILQFEPPAGRCQIRQSRGLTVIDDSYNANLESTLAAIDYLNAIRGNGQRIFVFGDMLELGNSSAEQHKQVGKKCESVRLSAVFTIGKESKVTDEQLKSIPVHEHFNDQQVLLAALEKQIRKGDKILIKGSRGMKMETIVEALVED